MQDPEFFKHLDPYKEDFFYLTEREAEEEEKEKRSTGKKPVSCFPRSCTPRPDDSFFSNFNVYLHDWLRKVMTEEEEVNK